MIAGFDINSTSRPAYVDIMQVHQAGSAGTATDTMSPIELFVMLNGDGRSHSVTASITPAGLERFSLRPSYEHQAWLAETAERISACRNFRDGWDGDAAIAPSTEAIDAAETLAVLFALVPYQIRPQFSVDALGRPTFARNVENFYLHLTIDSGKQITWFAEHDGQEHFQDAVSFNGRSIPEGLELLFGQAQG